MTPNPDETLKTESMQHLRAQYAGILTESQIEKHYRTYVEAFEAEKMFRFPLLPKLVARLYLRLCGRNPRFLDTSIFYCTNRGVLNACRETGYRILVPGVDKILHPESCRSNKTRRIAEWTKRLHIQSIVNLLLSARHSCPFKPTILIRAKKD